MNLKRSMRKLRATVAVFSPRRRRWEQFLRSLPLDPDRLPRPLASPGQRDFIICGSPRTGTTLACAMLHQAPRVITVMEPWDGMRLPPAGLFASLREEIRETGRLKRGKLDLLALREEGAVKWCHEGDQGFEISVDPDYSLGVKWPAFWRYLELLPATKFIVCLRHPFEVIASYRKAGGRLARGLNYDTAFNRTMNTALMRATGDEALRRILMFDYIHVRLMPYLSRPNVFALRFERWFTERESVLRDLSAFLDTDLGIGFPLLHRPGREADLSVDERTRIRAHCTTAEALGYALTDPVART